MKKNLKIFFICSHFFMLVTLILEPISQNLYITELSNNEIREHTKLVIHATAALNEGQFPVRVSPLMHNHYGNAFFQFYSPIFYNASALSHKFLFPDNPYLALKFVVFVSLFLAALFFYRIVYLFTNSNIIGVLSASVYVLSPYLILKIFGHGHMAEVIAQCMVPIVLYYSLKIFFSKSFRLQSVLLAGISWFFLLCTHLVTYVYFSLFFACVLLIYTFVSRTNYKQLCLVGVSYFFGILLGSYYVIPIFLYEKILLVNAAVQMTLNSSTLTHLPSLMSSVPSIPYPHIITADVREAKTYLSFGLPTLLGIVGIIYILFFSKSLLQKKLRIFSIALLNVFFIVFFCIWTPFNFWRYTPQILQIGQGTFRLFTQAMWIGTILFSMVLYAFSKNKLDLRHAFIGFSLVFLCLRPWITLNDGYTTIPIQSLKENPRIMAERDYLVNNNFLKEEEKIMTSFLDEEVINCKQGKNTVCHVRAAEKVNNIQLPLFYYPGMLNILANGKKISYYPVKFSNFTLTGITLPPGEYKIIAHFQGLKWANWVSVFSWIFTCIFLLQIFAKRITFKFREYLETKHLT